MLVRYGLYLMEDKATKLTPRHFTTVNRDSEYSVTLKGSDSEIYKMHM